MKLPDVSFWAKSYSWELPQLPFPVFTPLTHTRTLLFLNKSNWWLSSFAFTQALYENAIKILICHKAWAVLLKVKDCQDKSGKKTRIEGCVGSILKSLYFRDSSLECFKETQFVPKGFSHPLPLQDQAPSWLEAGNKAVQCGPFQIHRLCGFQFPFCVWHGANFQELI